MKGHRPLSDAEWYFYCDGLKYRDVERNAQLLLERGVTGNETDEEGLDMLLWACVSAELIHVKQLFLFPHLDIKRITPAGHCCINFLGNVRAKHVRFLIDMGMPIDGLWAGRYTVIDMMDQNRVGAVRVLLDQGVETASPLQMRHKQYQKRAQARRNWCRRVCAILILSKRVGNPDATRLVTSLVWRSVCMTPKRWLL